MAGPFLFAGIVVVFITETRQVQTGWSKYEADAAFGLGGGDCGRVLLLHYLALEFPARNPSLELAHPARSGGDYRGRTRSIARRRRAEQHLGLQKKYPL